MSNGLLQTTIAGSLPKPEWLAGPQQLWAPWLLEGERLAEAKRDAVRLVVFDQEHAGIDIVSSEYATVAAEQTALENLSDTVAEQIVTRLALYAQRTQASK